MISKKYRLTENEVKKVLKNWKPFFSYWAVLNYKNNNVENNRFAIIISGKNISGSVERNFFRRRFYDSIDIKLLDKHLDTKSSYDFVFVMKRQTKLVKNSDESIKSFDNDIRFLIKAINDKVIKGDYIER